MTSGKDPRLRCVVALHHIQETLRCRLRFLREN